MDSDPQKENAPTPQPQEEIAYQFLDAIYEKMMEDARNGCLKFQNE